MIVKRPRRRRNLIALALNAPLPVIVTCKGMGLSWPGGGATRCAFPDPYDTDEPCPQCRRDVDACTCGIIHPWKRAEQTA